ncbi:MAG: AMP-dependent synthetase/ligase [Spirochaetota bacterium]
MKKTIPHLLQQIKTDYPDTPAQYVKDDAGVFHPRTYQQLYREVLAFALALRELGVTRGDHVGLISENRAEWFVSDLAILSLGAADVPRGNDSMPGELKYILSFAGCKIVIVENAVQLTKVAGVIDELPALQTIIVLERHYDEETLRSESREALSNVQVTLYSDLIETGRKALGDGGAEASAAASGDASSRRSEGAETIEAEIARGEADDTATIIFTSGTTGTPKGVVLSHHNFLHQVSCTPDILNVAPGDIWLAVLPVWHSFERIIQYLALGSASALAYSKPVGKIMLADFAGVRPQWMGSVPRIWESVRSGIVKKVRAEGGAKWALFRFFVAVGGAHKHAEDLLMARVPDFKRRSRIVDALVAFLPWLVLKPLALLGSALVFGKIKARLGGRFVAGISGGGALPQAVDQFFAAAGILLLEGYGLTETAPVLAVRRQHRPVPGTVGSLLRDTECQIRDEHGHALPPGNQGIVFVRGPQVMSGYYNEPERTAEVLSSDGWFNTGDLGMLTHRGELKITGRAKDTIVLRGGENIEPQPIEQKLRESELIDQAVVLGQDQKFLGALIVPNAEALRQALEETEAGTSRGAEAVESPGGTLSEAATPTTAETAGTEDAELAALIKKPAARTVIEREVAELVSGKHGFRGFEQITRLLIVADQFQIGDELSAKQEVKRHVINERYAAEIAQLFE